MASSDPTSRFEAALTQASLGRIPPELHIATGHDGHVVLFLIRVGDAKAAADTLMDIITLSESVPIVSGFSETGGLIRKRLHIDDAQRIRERLEVTGTEVEFVKPEESDDAGP